RRRRQLRDARPQGHHVGDQDARTRPDADPRARNEAEARSGVGGDRCVEPTTPAAVATHAPSGKSVVKSSEGLTWRDGGVASSETRDRKDTTSATGVERQISRTSSDVTAAGSTSRSQTQSVGFDAQKGEVKVGRSSEARQETYDGKGLPTGEKSTTQSGASVTIGVGTAKVEATHTATVDPKTGKATTLTATGSGRVGPGVVGATASGELFVGTKDDQTGQTTKGTKVTGAADAQARGTDTSVGAGVRGSGAVEHTTAPQRSTTFSPTAGVTADLVVEPVPGSYPTQYQLRMTLALDAGGTIGHARGGELPGADGKGQVGASAGVSGALRRTWTTVLEGPAAEQAVREFKAGAGGLVPGGNVLGLVRKQGAAALRQALDGGAADDSNPDAIERLKPGDGVETVKSVTGTAGVDASGELGAGKGGVTAKGSATRSWRTHVRNEKGVYVIEVEEADASETTKGATVTPGVTSVGASGSSTSGTSKAVTFRLDPKDGDWKARLQRIQQQRSLTDLQTLALEPGFGGEVAHGSTSGGAATATASVGPLAGRVSATGTTTKKVISDDKGVKGTAQQTTAGATMSASINGVSLAKHEDTGTITQKVDTRANTASGEVKRTQGTDIPLLRGTGAKPTESRESSGAMSDDTYGALATLAKDKKAFIHHTSDPDALQALYALRKELLAAKGSRELMADAFDRFQKANPERATELLKLVGDVTRDGGESALREFPSEIAHEKARYLALTSDTFVSALTQVPQGELPAAWRARVLDVERLIGAISQCSTFEDTQVKIEMINRLTGVKKRLNAVWAQRAPKAAPKATVPAAAAAPE
ncbi:MAG TPA: hypothetical protein PKA64_18985, partial [Myxococcota bacterium]|nr:hypothetical protein [Myxococcota bacterium]